MMRYAVAALIGATLFAGAAHADDTADIAAQVAKGSFFGTVEWQFSNQMTWPFEVTNIVMKPGNRFTATITWPTENMSSEGYGAISDGKLVFGETKAIGTKKREMKLCQFTAKKDKEGVLRGRTNKCNSGKFVVDFLP
jgi:hypothetical protein